LVPFLYPCCTNPNIWRNLVLKNSQYENPGTSSAFIADSFQIPALTTWNLTSAEFIGETSSTGVAAVEWRLFFYDSQPFADDPRYLIPNENKVMASFAYRFQTLQGSGSLALNLGSLILTTGTYWVTFFPFLTTATNGTWFQEVVCPWKNITNPPVSPPLANAPPAAFFQNYAKNPMALIYQYANLIYHDLISSGIVFFHSQRLPPPLFTITQLSRMAPSK
jgi:hypothetical protein